MPDWSAVLSGRSVDEIASRLASLPPSVQEAAAAAFDGDGTSAGAALPSPVAAHSSAPWEQAAGTISDLLHEVELASLYLDTFEEYDYSRVGQLTQLGREGCAAALQELGITRDHRDRITNLAFSKRPLGTCGSCFSDHFLSAIRPAFASTMGCENMGILLYALCRFLKPQGVLEVGAGVTSLWLLQALRDNHEELGRCAAAQKEDWKGYRVGSLPGAEWMVEEELEPRAATVPILHCVDRISHGHTTAHKVATAADELGLSAHLKFHEVDGYELASTFAKSESSDTAIDFIWLDFGVGVGGRLDEFLNAWWPRLKPGGWLLIHSTLTNAVTRQWLEKMRARRSCPTADGETEGVSAPPGNALGSEFSEMSFLEPHKRYQNACSLFQKRSDGYAEPYLTTYP